MWRIQRTDLPESRETTNYFSFVGGGGKSTLIDYFAHQASRSGRAVAITTTTKIYAREPYLLFDDFDPSAPFDFDPARGKITRIGKTRKGEKLTALSFDDLRALKGSFDTILIEADGAKHLPLKYPAGHEPVIPPFSDRIFVIAGLDALHGKVADKVFRWELFSRLTGISPDAPVTSDLFLTFFSEPILLKGVETDKCTVVLNKYDTLSERREGLVLARKILERSGIDEVVVSSLFYHAFYRMTSSRPAAIPADRPTHLFP